MKRNVWFVQVDVSSGKDSKVVYLPYTAGVIVANAWRNEKVAASYEFIIPARADSPVADTGLVT